MGEDKAFMKYGNRFMYEYSLDILRHFSIDILISSSDMRFTNVTCRTVEDEIPNTGPLGGIYSCLKQIQNKSAIVLACDLPLITTEIIEILIKNSKGFDLSIIVNDKNLPEPLIGIYSSSLVPIIQKMIAENHYKIQGLFKLVKTKLVKIPEVSPEVFKNINLLEEFNSLPPQ